MFVHHFLSFWIHDCIIHLGNEPHHLGLPKYDIDKMLWKLKIENNDDLASFSMYWGFNYHS